MKRFLKHIVLFVLLFFIVEKITYIFLLEAPKREYDKRLETVLEGKMNKELIVLGSSKGASDVLAGQLENETGFTSYNLSYEGSNVIFHEFVLKTLLKYNSVPKIVVLVIDTPYEFIEEASLKFRIDRLIPLSKYNYINSELIKQKEKNFLSWFFMLSRINRSNLEFHKRKPFHFNPIDSSGSRPYIVRNNKKKLDFSNNVISYNAKEELTNKLTSFTNIQYMCKMNNIELIFALPPNFKTFNSTFVSRFKSLMNPKERLFIYDTLNPIYREKEYYNDYSHLFKNGAQIFTSEISTFINSINNQ
ncbi:hypothetical protein [Olleya sp. YS]|uniref:hypothetical protein n=1 Tax=Olleya sp. YS TaxID=3028318 RepID=UPI0024342715|nr:hypothetical protein [Olleya sp. YS]WGD34876.1 hypothetical protein Ollyesu_00335 [Olleya sp. YS]